MKKFAVPAVLAFAFSALVLCAPAPASAAGPAEPRVGEGLPPLLKNAVQVEDEFIRLQDIFDNLAAKHQVTVAYAPPPGKRTVFDARWLQSVAQAYSVNWKPSSVYDRITVERPSQIIGREMIETEIMRSLVSQGVPKNSEIELTNQSVQIHIPTNQPSTVAVKDISFDPRSRRFTALLETPAGSPSASLIKMHGRVFAMTEIPVFARNISKGEAIGPKDVKFQPIRVDQVRHDTITSPDQAFGQAARQFIKAGEPIRAVDLVRPVLVPKNSLVTMVLRFRGMTLTTQGKAMEDGGAGDVIRVANSQSQTVVEAKVDGPNLVSVSAPSARILAN